jgi:hypothetical protein
MSTLPREPDREREPETPARLAGGLRALYRTNVPAGTGLDEAVFALARERAALGGRARRRLGLLRWGMVAAAGLAVGVFLSVRLIHPSGPHGGSLAGDVNGDGRVDILDALVLARAVQGAPDGVGQTSPRLRSGLGNAALRGEWDLNHDGKIDGADVDLVAMQAVRLTPAAGGRAG